jgi:hypothetical protein
VQTPLQIDLQCVVGQHADPHLALAAFVVAHGRDRLTGYQHPTAVLGDAVRLDLVSEVPHPRTHGDREQHPEQVHTTSLSHRVGCRRSPPVTVVGVCWPPTCENGVVIAGDFSDPTNERIIYLSAAGLAIVGVALLVGTILWWRRGRREHPALAPLEIMGGRAWTKAPEGDRRRRLDQVRVGGGGQEGEEPVRADPVDLQALVRSVPQAFDDLREPSEVVVEPVVDEPVADESVADHSVEDGQPVVEGDEPVADDEPVVEGDEPVADDEPVAEGEEPVEDEPVEAVEVLATGPIDPSA